MDMAGGAGAAPSSQRQQLGEAVVADHLHEEEERRPFDRGFASVACDDRELGHVWKLSLKAEKGKASAASYARRSPSIKAEGSRVGIPAERVRESLDELAKREPLFAEALAEAGYPEPKIGRAHGCT